MFFVFYFIFWKILGSVCNRTQVTKTVVTLSTKGWTVLHLQCIVNDLNCLRAVVHKWYNKSKKLLIFGKIFQWCLYWIFELSNYQRMIKAYINTPYKKMGFFSVFEKKWKWKEKKQMLSYPWLRYAHKKLNFACKKFFLENVCLRTKFDLQLKKNLESPSKKCQSYNFLIWKFYGKYFLYTLDVWNCMILIFVVWNCMISSFGVWRSTRGPTLG